MRRFTKLVVAGAAAFVVLQLVRPGIPSRPAAAELQAPPEVKRILEKDCYSCHSDQRRLAWFDRIVPAYWLVRHDILIAREHLNFSTVGAKPAVAQKATLYEAVNMIQLGAMPLPQFVKLHPEAKVTAEDLATLKGYLTPWSSIGNSNAAAAANSSVRPAVVSLDGVQPELNGLPFDPDFEKWKLISTTDRGDNNTFRFILGNDIAVKAAQAGNISPWPDGTRFAKIAWQQTAGRDGLVMPGKFVQVELMVKDAERFRKTEGWGWGRWRGLDLKPYGSNAQFVNECTACHLPVRGNDYVYTLPISAARVDKDEVVNGRAAALPAALPYKPFGWGAITMYVDPSTRTTATIFGNDIAMKAVNARGAQAGDTASYPAGAVLALVTWAQRDDPHWFGGRIPDTPISAEFVELEPEGQQSTYRRFAGADLTEERVTGQLAEQRMKFLLNLAPAQLP